MLVDFRRNKDAWKYLVLDLDTGWYIDDVCLADDEAGIYEVIMTRDGKFILDSGGFPMTETRVGNIMIIRNEESICD